jgi:hypothetical protein
MAYLRLEGVRITNKADLRRSLLQANGQQLMATNRFQRLHLSGYSIVNAAAGKWCSAIKPSIVHMELSSGVKEQALSIASK